MPRKTVTKPVIWKRGKIESKCKRCDDTYYQYHPKQQYCSPACKIAAWRARKAEAASKLSKV